MNIPNTTQNQTNRQDESLVHSETHLGTTTEHPDSTMSEETHPNIEHRPESDDHPYPSRKFKRSAAYRYDREFIEELRSQLPDYLEGIGIDLRESGTRLICLCPLHYDTNPSFAVFGDGHEVCGCYVCDFTCDVFGLSQMLGRSKSFPQAVVDVAEVLGIHLPDCSGPTCRRSNSGEFSQTEQMPKSLDKKNRKESLPLTDHQKFLRMASRYAFRDAVRTEPDRLEEFVNELGIPLDILIQARCGGSGIGIYDGLLSYIYPTGLKVRNLPGSRIRFYWEFGTASTPWRFDRVGPAISKIYLTESESDALTLIACGVEKDPSSAVVACPGTGFQEAWAELFTGKSVIICFDFDVAGRTAARKVERLLSDHAESVKILKQNEH